MRMRDTIYATSTGAPPSAIAIVRISGVRAREIGTALTGGLPEPRRAGVRMLRDALRDGVALDRAVVLLFPGPRSATGEDIVELHLHGGRAVIAAVESAIAAVPGARLAEPGEFTRRALENGVIDLSAAEGLGDLLAAQTEAQRRAALRVAEGGLRQRIDHWTDRLIAIAARIEAQIDFSDEDDVAEEGIEAILADVSTVTRDIAALLAVPSVERLRDGIRVVIAGPPNSGKSTLINALAGRDVAIVSPISGTTRDRIEASVERAGVAYILTDTAGLTDMPGDSIERIGIERARAAIQSADLILWLADGDAGKAEYLQVHARCDLPDRIVAPTGRIAVSAKSGYGIEPLWARIAARAATMLPPEDGLTTNARQRGLLESCRTCLEAIDGRDLLIVAEHLRLALRALDSVAGRSGVEDVLDAMFAQFCIGK